MTTALTTGQLGGSRHATMYCPQIWKAVPWFLAGILAFCPSRVLFAQGTSSGVTFDESLTGDAALSQALRDAQLTPSDLPLSVRLVVERTDLERQPGVYDFGALDARMALYRQLEGGIYIDLRDTLPASETVEAWVRFVRAVSGRYRGAVRGYIFGVATSHSSGPEYAFYLKSTVVGLRGGDDKALMVLGGILDGDREWLESLYREDIAAYVDVVGLGAGSTDPAILALVEQHDSSSGIVILGESLGEDPTAGPARFLNRELDVLGTRVSAATYAASRPVVAAVLPSIVALRGLLGQDLVSLDESAVQLRLTRAGQDVTDVVRHRLLFGLGTSTNYFVYSAAEGPLELTLSERTGTRPLIIHPRRNRREPLQSFTYDAASSVAHIGLLTDTAPLVVDWSTGEEPIATCTDVSFTVLPSVAEIIARHQQAQAAQDVALQSYVANAVMEQHFRPAGMDSSFDVVTENRFFVEGKNVEWEERSFRLNGTRWGADRPPFPLLQAEKVLSLPLDLRLNTDYGYRFGGVETVEQRECYVLHFDPVDVTRSLFRGTVWIDRQTYLKVKVQTIQTQLSAPVASSEEIQYFSPAGVVEGREIHLLTRLVGRQIMLIAGRNLLVEREMRFEAFELNPDDFAMMRETARAGGNIMYRDTDQGLRYLVKRDGARVVQDVTTLSALAGAMGVTYDPAYDYPLPLGGVNYLDFNFLGEDNQLAVLFGGVLALVNVQRPQLLGQNVDGSLDLFVIGVNSNDRLYDQRGELTDQRLLTRPFSTGINLGWQMTDFQKLGFNYQLRFDAFSTDDATATEFRPPVSTFTNGVGLSWEWKQGGYSLAAGATRYQRAKWDEWGGPGDFHPSDKDYIKYTASVTKEFFFGFHKLRFNTAYYGGRDLDRFSAYQFGFFDENRVHGVPASGIRFGELAMARGAYSFNLFDEYRLDVFLDRAVGRYRRLSSAWQGMTGLGVGFNMRGPWSTLLRGDVGKSFLPEQYREPGSVVFQFQVLKPL